ncbi:AI-2E family transporter [Conexibacter arvalis]|uniref:Putative PurR-regulated permease PerM n=1 Tax=Conexibacter arvalis TaxID=912552 RepID=A0A840IKC2_9ACTN|nr:AI-2E family transporter [Conexibacter arvalis]MBB4664775.1 putative PurR-regulated permease PerM [Conexibacter arvalis]
MLDRRRRRRPAKSPDGVALPADEIVALDAADATADLATPRWLRDLGTSAWLIAGVGVVLVGAVWIASLTQTIVTPVITAAVLASVMSPLVSRLHRHGVPRGLAAALLLLGVVALGVAVTLVVVGGVTGESAALRDHLSQARQTITGWLTDLGIPAGQAHDGDHDVSSAIGKAVPALLHGVSSGIAGLSSLVVFLSFTVLSLFFLLKDGPAIRDWGERHMGLPAPLARAVSARSLQSLRGYFLGVTIVAAFNAVVVGLGALLLGVPLAGTLAVVTFVGAYVPYVGAWGAGAFSVLVALGGGGSDAAIGMIVVQLLANGILQQLLQPIAYGAALGIHPLAVLIVTIAGGSLFGAVGLILAAPVTAAVTRISADLRRARAVDDGSAPT